MPLYRYKEIDVKSGQLGMLKIYKLWGFVYYYFRKLPNLRPTSELLWFNTLFAVNHSDPDSKTSSECDRNQ